MNTPLSYRIAAAAASALLLAGLIATLSGFDPRVAAIKENRKLSAPPSATLSEWQRFIDETNAYIGDHFGFRTVLIRSHAIFREHVLNANSSDNIFLNAIGLDGN
jgi:hypothetical protein